MIYEFGKFESLLLYLVVYTMIANSKTFADKINIGGNSNRFIWYFIVLFLPFCIAGFRYNVGADYWQYLVSFESRKYSDILGSLLSLDFYSIINSGDSIGILVTSMLVGLFDYNENLYFGLLGVFSLCPVVYLLRNKFSNISFSFAVFIYLLGGFSTGFNIIKQIVAVAVALVGYNYVLERKIYKFLICFLIAFAFHPSALVIFPVYFLYNKDEEMPTYIKYIVVLLTVLFIVNINTILLMLGDRYGSYARELISGNYSIIPMIFWLSVFYYLKDRLIELDTRNKLLIYLYFIGVVLYFVGFYSFFVKRIAMYFTCVDFLLLAQLPYVFENLSGKIVKVLVLTYVIAYFVLLSYILGQVNIFPYTMQIF